VEWMRGRLSPDFIDLEDINIFRIVDRPKDAVAIVKEGQKQRWWKPSNGRLKQIAKNSGGVEGPMSGPDSKDGEGTRYGIRPTPAKARHAVAAKKPTS